MTQRQCHSLLLLLTAAWLFSGCEREGAIRAVISVAPGQPASCVILTVRDPGGGVLEESRLERTGSEGRLVVAIYRGTLPESLELRAEPLYGAGCEAPLRPNGGAVSQRLQFPPRGVEEVTLQLAPPDAEDDADRDGVSGPQAGGADCDDGAADAFPGAPEACTTTRDLNCNAQVGCADPACAGQACAKVPSALAFVSPERSVEVDECSEPVIIETRDEQGAALVLSGPLPVAVGEVSGAAALFTDSNCSTPVETLVLSAGDTRGIFYFRSTTAGVLRLRVSASGIPPGEQDATVRAGPPTSVRLSATGQPVFAGVCSPPLSVSLLDAYGNAATASGPLSVSLTALSGSVGLFADGNCTDSTAALSFAAGAGAQSFWLHGTTAESVTLRADGAAAGLGDDTEVVSIQPAAASSLTFLTAAHSVPVRTCSPPLTVQTRDTFGNVAPVTAATELLLSATGLGGFGLFSDSGCTLPAPKLPLPAGAATATFYFRGTAPGTATVQVSGAGLGSTSQQQTVEPPLVRAGTCTISANATTAGNCGFSPALANLGRTVLFYQATSPAAAAEDSSVMCSLEADTVACTRAGTAGIVNISWYAAELPEGASVQRATFPCSNNSTSLQWPVPSPVPEAESFVLLSGRRGGADNVDSVFSAAQLVSSGAEVAIDPESCFHGQQYAVQVVHLPGASVTRGSVAAFGASPTRVTGLSTVDRTRTFLLYSAASTTTAPERLCERMLRARLDSDTSLELSRGDGATECDDNTMTVEWQRIELPAGNRVQELQVEAGTLAAVVQAMAPVDLNRAVAFTGAHGSTGQGGGEGSLPATAPSELRARLTFDDADTVRLTRGAGAPTATATFGVYVLELAQPE